MGREELKVKSIRHCAMLEDAMHLGTEADVFAHVLDTNGMKTPLKGLLDTGAFLSVIPIETWKHMGFDKDDLIDSRIRLSAANKGSAKGASQNANHSRKFRKRNLRMSFLAVENLEESEQFILGNDFIKNFDVTIELNNAMIRLRSPERKYVTKPLSMIMTRSEKLLFF